MFSQDRTLLVGIRLPLELTQFRETDALVCQDMSSYMHARSEPGKSNFFVLRALRGFQGSRFDVSAGETRQIRYGYAEPLFVPHVVAQCRKGEAIDWGGAAVQPQDYAILFDGPGPLPACFKTAAGLLT